MKIERCKKCRGLYYKSSIEGWQKVGLRKDCRHAMEVVVDD